MTVKLTKAQDKVAELYKAHGYDNDLHILGLGLCEEAGEVAAAILDRSQYFKPKEGRVKSDLEHELKDALIYLLAIANAANIELELE